MDLHQNVIILLDLLDAPPWSWNFLGSSNKRVLEPNVQVVGWSLERRSATTNR